MAVRRIDYQVGFTVDKSQLDYLVKEAQQSLAKLSNINTEDTLTVGMQEAAIAARDLQSHLAAAVNVNTGKLDLSKFMASLKAGGTSLEQYRDKLTSIGEEGQLAFLKVANALTRANQPMMRSNELMSRLWTTMKNTARWQLTSGMLHGFIGAVETAYGYAKNLDESLNSIRIVTQKSTEDMARFAQQANEAAKALSTTTTNYTDASLIYYQQGLPDDQVAGRTEATIKLANVAGQTAEETSEQLTAIWNNFYDGSKSLEYYIDVMAKLGATTASSTAEIAEGLQKFAPIASTVGLSYESAAAALATLTATTRESADVVGTALRTLFARIQGLQQGNTEDGVDLNKYSQALRNVGIEVLNADGSLKSMDETLEEMGEKWQTLTKAQQVALAETVAGVRQYSQLIALMDKWDFFQQNRATALGSEGTLQEQFDIFEESWQAARNRVKASWEDIYDSLFKSESFIEFADDLSVVLDRVDDVFDALGGLKGILLTIGTISTQVFSKQMAQGLRDMTYNLGFKGNVNEQQVYLQRQVDAIANDEKIWGSASVKARIQDLQLQNEINAVAKDLTEQQVRQLTNIKDIILALHEAKEEWEGQRIEAEKAAQAAGEVAVKAREAKVKEAGEKWQYREFTDGRAAPIKDIKTALTTYDIQGLRGYKDVLGTSDASKVTQSLKTLFNESQKSREGMEKLVTIFNKFTQVKSEVDAVAKALGQIPQSAKSSEAETARLVVRLEELLGNQGWKQAAADGTLGDRVADAQKVLSKAEATFAEDLQSMKLDTSGLDTANEKVSQLVHNTESVTGATQQMNDTFEQTKRTMSAPPPDWASSLISGANAAMQFGMAINGVRSIISTINNDDLSSIEKWTQILTSSAMVITPLVTTIRSLTIARRSDATAAVSQTTATTAETAAETANTGATAANTKAVRANTAAWMANPIGWIALGVGLLITAFTTLNSIIEENTRKTREHAAAELEDAKAAADATREENEEAQKLYKNYIELRSSVDETSDSKAALRDSTDKLCEALGVEWDALDRLQGKYEVVNREIADANKKLAERGIEDSLSEIRAAQREMGTYWKYGEYGVDTNPDQSYSHRPTYTYFQGYKVTFDAGLDFYGDETEVYNAFKETFESLGAYVTNAGGKMNVYFEEDNFDLVSIYEALQERYDMLDKSDDILTNSQKEESEVWDEIYQFLKNNKSDYNDIIKLRQDLTNYAEQLAEAELALGDLDLSQVEGVDEYREARSQFIEQLEAVFTEKAEKDPEFAAAIEGLDLEKLADGYLKAYTNLKTYVDELSVAESIISRVGEGNRDLIERLVQDRDNYDLNVLDSKWMDWDAITMADDIEAAIKEAYEIAKAKVDAETFEVQLSVVTTSISTLSAGKELSDDELAVVKQLEEEYPALAAIRDRTSAQYIQALRDIREGMEHALALDKVKDLQDAWDDLFHKIQGTIIPDFGDKLIVDDIDIKAVLDLEDGDFQKKMKAIMDADYAVQVAIETDLQSDVDDIINRIKDVTSATSKIQEGFTIAWTDAMELQRVFPGILAGYTTTADGMIQLNAELAQNMVDLAQTEIDNRTAATKHDIETYKQVLLAKAAAMRQISEGLAQLAQSEVDSSVSAADAKAKIEEGMVNFQKACDDEIGLASNDLANSEIDDSNDVGSAAEQAASQSASNWASAYNSMMQNSADWANTAIANARAVADAMAQAASAGSAGSTAVTASAVNGGTSSSYSGTFSEASTSGVYESRGGSGVSWYDYYSDPNAGYDEYMKASAAAAQQAQAFEAAAAALDGMMAQLDGANAAVGDIANNLGKGTGGGGSNKVADALDPKKLKEVEDRYHNINRLLEQIADRYDDINKVEGRSAGKQRLAILKQELDILGHQLEVEEEKLAAAIDYRDGRGQPGDEDYLEGDLDRIKRLFGESAQIIVGDGGIGDILNYEELLGESVKMYNDFVNAYNAQTAGHELSEAEKKYWDKAKKAAEDAFKERNDALKQYEETIDTIREVENTIEEVKRNIEDNRLTQIEYELEVALDIKSLDQALLELKKKIAESYGDALNYTRPSLKLSAESASIEISKLDDYQKEQERLIALWNEAVAGNEAIDTQRILEDLKELNEEMYSSADALLEWLDEWENGFVNALDAAAERFAYFTDRLAHNKTILDTVKELMVLQGVSIKTEQGFQDLQNTLEARLKTQVTEAQLNRQWFEGLQERYEQAERELAMAQEGDINYDRLKNNRDALLEEMESAEEAMYTSAKEAMETAQEMYLQQIERAQYEFGKAISGGLGLDLLRDKYDHYIEKNERYLDQVNEAYQVASWYDKLQADIDKTTSKLYKDRLRALQEEIDLRRENNTLSQYDLDILEAKYNVLQAQMALEEAQNAKNTLRLVRDRQGNWNYQYTANPEDVEGAQQNLADAENEWYNIAKERAVEITDQIITTWQEAHDKVAEIYSDSSNFVYNELTGRMELTEEAEAKIADIWEYYTNKVKYLEDEKNIALQDMTEAGNQELFHLAVTHADQIEDLTGITAADIEKIVDETGLSVQALLTGDYNAISQIVTDTCGEFNSLKTEFRDDLADMTENTKNFDHDFKEYIGSCEGVFGQYGKTVQEVATATGTTLDGPGGLREKVENLTTKSEELGTKGSEAIDKVFEKLDEIHDLTTAMDELANSVEEALKKIQELAATDDIVIKTIYETEYRTIGEPASPPETTGGTQTQTVYTPPPGGDTGNGNGNGGNGGNGGNSNDNASKAGVYVVYSPTVPSEILGKYSLKSAAQRDIKKAQEAHPVGDMDYNYFAGLLVEFRTGVSGLQKLSYDTGGYTGTWGNEGRLAFLHQKELVLNASDTENMLQAVDLVRNIPDAIFKSIEAILDGNASAAINLMGSKLSVPAAVASATTVEQDVHITAEFPNVREAREIEEALNSLIDDAAQYSQRRTD